MVNILLYPLIVAGTFLVWEFVAWFTHRFVMHGFLWSWHRSHHTVHHHKAERNDLFALVFSIPCMALFYYATLVNFNPYLICVAIGIFCYGVFYLIFHDIIVHQRIRLRLRKKGRYLQRMINAHYIHHARHTRDGCEAFGFLIVPGKYAPKNFRMRESRQDTQ
jgi:beta-carotene 3-hydroxylase